MPTINVTVYDSTENKRVPVELPDDAPCNKIIAVLVQKLRLPSNGPDGAPLSYKFHHKNSGRQVQDTQTLAEAQVQDGDILRLQPEITAGGCAGDADDTAKRVSGRSIQPLAAYPLVGSGENFGLPRFGGGRGRAGE